jgi:hypothetical protein
MTETRFQVEERRAREYRARQARIAANRRALAQRIPAHAAAYKAEIDADWRPYVMARRDWQVVATDEPDDDTSEEWR